ncbi:MAG: outer membrane protein assembly factor BamD [Planctomycetes bacterium]|nr:outer membrane protein assembly factor BamD [Planctomycetota bacterium]
MTHRSPCRTSVAALALTAAVLALPGCFVTRAIGLGPDPDPADPQKGDTPDVIYEKGRALFAAKEWRRADDAFSLVWKDHPSSPYAADARFYDAECRYALEKWNGALEMYKGFMKAQPLSPHAPLVQRRLYDMGVFQLEDGARHVFDTSGEGVDALEYIVQAFPNGDLADDALIQVADHDMRYNRPQDAVQHLHDLVDRYPGSEWAYEARLRLARAYRELNRGAKYDADALQRAAAQYRAYVALVSLEPARAAEYAPNIAAANAELGEVEETLARKGIETADFYLYDGRTDAARAELRNVIKSWPDTPSAAEARARLGDDTAPGGTSK